MANSDMQKLLSIIGSKKNSDVELIEHTLSKMSEADFADLIKQVENQSSPTTVAYIIVPLLQLHAERSLQGYKKILSLLIAPGFNRVSISALIQILRKSTIAHEDSAKKLHIKTVMTFLQTKSTPNNLKTQALRSLSIHRPNQIQKLLINIAKSNSVSIIDGIADVLLAWKNAKLSSSAELLQTLSAFARKQPAKAITAPSLVRLLSQSRRDQDLLIVKSLITKANKSEHWETLIRNSARWLPAPMISRILTGAVKKPTNRTRVAIRALFSQNTFLFMKLYRGKQYQTFVEMIEFIPEAVRDSKIVAGLQLLIRKPPNKKIQAQLTHYFKFYTVKPLANHPMLTWEEPELKGVTRAPQITSDGWASGLQLGDATYRQLALSPINIPESGLETLAEHWHAGIVAGFSQSIDSDIFRLEGVQVDNWSNITHEVFMFDGSSDSIRARSADLPNEMRGIFDRWLAGFHTDQNGYEGARSVPNISYTSRRNIVNTAEALIGEPITYCLDDMLQWSSWPFSPFDGTIDNIFALRCDGVIEYAYESNNLRVMNGMNNGQWDVTINPPNHNHMHGSIPWFNCNEGNYSIGDTCPRIQAGEVGSDTTLQTSPPAKPVISDIRNSQFCGYRNLRFSISAIASRFAYIRILVGKSNRQQRFFLKSENPSTSGTGFQDAVWALKREDILSTNGDVALMWLGKTVRTTARTVSLFGSVAFIRTEELGPDFNGDDGPYDFIIQCIDEGGNVSDEWTHQVNISWK